MKLFDYFKTQFVDFEGALKWYNNWRYEWDQDIPGRPEDSGENCFSMRAMAGHISLYLEGKKEEDWNGSYFYTEYGPDLYLS